MKTFTKIGIFVLFISSILFGNACSITALPIGKSVSSSTSVAPAPFANKITTLTPKISGVSVTNLTPTTATFTWSTDTISDSEVFLGDGSFGTVYGADYGGFTAAADNVLGTLTHSVTVTGLIPGAGYVYALRSRGFSKGVPDLTKTAAYESQSSQQATFSTSVAPNNGDYDFVTGLYGPTHVMQGYEVYIGLSAADVSGVSSLDLGTVRAIVSNLPPFTAVHYPVVELIGQGNLATTFTINDTLILWSNIITEFEIVTNVGGITPPGSYTLNVTYSTQATGKTVTKNLTWPLTVDAPVPLPQAKPAFYPPIKDLGLWQTNMLTYGKKWCLQKGAPYDQTVYYYDGIHQFQQIRDYTGDSATWTPCINSVLTDYRDTYILPNKGAVPLIKMFARGLYQDYLDNGSALSATAITGLARFSSMGVSNGFMRETAYGADISRIASKIQPTYSVKALRGVDLLIGMVDQVVHGNRPYESFMCGLLASSLIAYYEDGHQSDIRIPLAVKALADYLYANAWRDEGPGYYSQPGVGSFFYSSYRDEIGLSALADDAGGDQIALNLLTAPMYAWLFQYTGDQIYQIEGDRIFNSGVEDNPGNGIGWSGKNFSQQYRWSFDFVKWRSAP